MVKSAFGLLHAFCGSMASIGHLVVASADEIVTIWDAAAKHLLELDLPRSQRRDSLADVVRALAEAALIEPKDPGTRDRLVRVSLLHGQHRRVQGVTEPVLLDEIRMLRQAIATFFHEQHPSVRAWEVLTKLDPVITTCALASLRGYHREELERTGKWSEVVARLVQTDRS